MGGLDHRHTFTWVFDIEMKIALGVFAAICAAMIYAFVQSAVRSRRGLPPSGKVEYKVKESLYTAVVAVIAGALVFMSIDANAPARHVRPVLTLHVTGYQWCWNFVYEGTPVQVNGTCTSASTDPTAVVPAHEPIRVVVTSADVIHGFWVPYLRFKIWAYPGHANTFDTVFPATGTFVGRCSEYCGIYHYDMDFRVRAVSPAAYRSWLASAARSAGRAS